MPLDVFFGVDGTGPASDAEYNESTANSFVKKFYELWENKNAAGYSRGPVGSDINPLSDVNTNDLGEKAYKFIFNLTKQRADYKTDARIFLAGHSRGGAAVINAAKRLNNDGISVFAMFLFDAVDRSPYVLSKKIPPNVINTYHAVCNVRTRSRYYFGNIGLTLEPALTLAKDRFSMTIDSDKQTKRLLEIKEFFCTHGAIGGNPWKKPEGKTDSDYIYEPFGVLPDTRTTVTYTQDQSESRAAGLWMFSNFLYLKGQK